MSDLSTVDGPELVTAKRPGPLGCKFGRRFKFILQRGVHRSIGLRSGTASALEKLNLKADYRLRRPFVEISESFFIVTPDHIRGNFLQESKVKEELFVKLLRLCPCHLICSVRLGKARNS